MPETANRGHGEPWVRLAETERDLHRVYRLRYEVLTAECGDERYADHDARTYRDRMDDSDGTHVFLAESSEGEIAGSVRVTFRSDTAFIRDEVFAFDELAARIGCDEDELLRGVWLNDRGVVAPGFRRQDVFSRLLDAADHFCLKAGKFVSLVVVESGSVAPVGVLRDRNHAPYTHARASGIEATCYYRCWTRPQSRP